MVKCKDCSYLVVRDGYNDQICQAGEGHALRDRFRFSLRVSWSFNELIRCLIAIRVTIAALPTPSVRIAASL
jgi:hypothetical protein